MARSPALLSAVVRILCAEIFRLMRQLSQQRGVRHEATGIVAIFQYLSGSIKRDRVGNCTLQPASKRKSPDVPTPSIPIRSRWGSLSAINTGGDDGDDAGVSPAPQCRWDHGW
ncbi:MAG TPA: hypothetical protein PK710_09595, partial [Polyangiaceae bacterium]|nr:hypothetical protein [Polyangiaceae bacterium]